MEQTSFSKLKTLKDSLKRFKWDSQRLKHDDKNRKVFNQEKKEERIFGKQAPTN